MLWACYYHCGYCQNCLLHKPARPNSRPLRRSDAEDFVTPAARHQAIIASPKMSPYHQRGAVEFSRGRKQGLSSLISNGKRKPEVSDICRPGRLIQGTSRASASQISKTRWPASTACGQHSRLYHKVWLEVNGDYSWLNDSNEESLTSLPFSRTFRRKPLQRTAFHKDYRMTDPDNTSVATLMGAAEIGRSAGLRYLYAGNLPGHVGGWENTMCPCCNTLLIERHGFRVRQNRLRNGACPTCQTAIPGVWD